MKKILKRIGLFLLVLFLLANAIVLLTGNSYLYKTLIYTYADIDDLHLFPVRTVANDQPRPWPFASDYNRNAMPVILQDTLEKYQTVAFLIIRNDSLLYEKYWENYSDSSISNSFSVAKSIVATLCGIAIQDGKLKLDQKISDFIPEYKEGRRAELTVRNLLMMSAGLTWDESYSSAFSVTTKAYYGTDLYKLLMKEQVVTTPGTEFNYQSGVTQLLGFVLTKATGMSLAEYASEKLWKPLGAEHAASWSLDHSDGYEKAYCCFYAAARDFARIGDLYLHHGNWYGKQIVDSSWVNLCTKLTPLKDHDTGLPNDEYGYHWWIGPDYYYCRGLQGQYIIVLPAEKMVIVRLGHARSEKDAHGKLTDVPYYVDQARKTWALR